MTRILIYTIAIIVLTACGKKDKKLAVQDKTPRVTQQGEQIMFPTSDNLAFFTTQQVSNADLKAEFSFPAKVSAAVVRSQEGAFSNIVLFDDEDLAGNYSQLVQHLINIHQIQNVNIRQKRIELEREKDLQSHGAATGKDVLEAQTELAAEQTNLANVKAAILEHEAALKAGGFDPEALQKAAPGTVFIICDVPESQIGEIEKGTDCSVKFNSFPEQEFKGRIDEIADMIDNATRMIKLRITLKNPEGKIKVGMFASISFGVKEKNTLSIDKNSLVTVQGKNYVFVKTSDNTFERRQVSTGTQINDRIIVYEGLKPGESVAVKGVMQLKGLSFGY